VAPAVAGSSYEFGMFACHPRGYSDACTRGLKNSQESGDVKGPLGAQAGARQCHLNPRSSEIYVDMSFPPSKKTLGLFDDPPGGFTCDGR